MKTQTLLALSLLITLTTAIGCKKDEVADAAAATGGGGTVTSKATLSKWKIINSAWFVRLDVAGNLNGTPFTMVYKYSDNSEVHCTNTEMTGTESSGTLDVNGSCTGPGTGSMADSGPTDFETTGGGSYSNNGSLLRLCATGSTNCISYYPTN